MNVPQAGEIYIHQDAIPPLYQLPHEVAISVFAGPAVRSLKAERTTEDAAALDHWNRMRLLGAMQLRAALADMTFVVPCQDVDYAIDVRPSCIRRPQIITS